MLLLVYALLIYYYHRTWDRIPVPSDSVKSLSNRPAHLLSSQPNSFLQKELSLPTVKVSVIVPARNEEGAIGNCLKSLFNQSYPKTYTEIIVVNDFSTDNTVALVEQYQDQCLLLHLSDYITDPINAYKKKAIETGISQSSGELIICTDADCTMGPEWISLLVDAHQRRDLAFIAAPVKIVPNGSAISVFQTLDFISLQGITGAAVHKNLYPNV